MSEFLFDTKKKVHKKSICSVIYFPLPNQRIVTSSEDNTIKIFDFEKLDCLHTYQCKKTVTSLLKWDSETFIGGSLDSSIVGFSLIEPFDVKQVFVGTQKFLGGVKKMYELTEDLFLVIGHIFCKIFGYSYSQNEVLETFSEFSDRLFGENIAKSSIIPGFYIEPLRTWNSKPCGNKLYLIDYKNQNIFSTESSTEENIMEEKVKGSTNPEALSSNCIVCFQNRYAQDEEIVIIGGVDYNYNRGFLNIFKSTKQTDGGSINIRLVRVFETGHRFVMCIFGLRTHFLFGDTCGGIQLFEMNPNHRDVVKFVSQTYVNLLDGHSLEGIVGLQVIFRTQEYARLIVSSSKGKLVFINIKGLGRATEEKEFEQIMQDEKERALLLLNDVELVFDSHVEEGNIMFSGTKEEGKSWHVSIQLYKLKIENIFRCFLLL